jgi:copper chaperone NosL
MRPRPSILAILAMPALLVLAVALGCAPAGPRALVAGEDACAYCRMTISDTRFGGEAITATGRVLTFDAIECMASWARSAPARDRQKLFVMDMQRPGTLVAADSAGFLLATTASSPMGRSIVSLASTASAESARATLGGRVATWRDILADSSATVSH